MTDNMTETVEPTVAELENEGDVAADYLEELLDIADIDGDLNLDVAKAAPTCRSRLREMDWLCCRLPTRCRLFRN